MFTDFAKRTVDRTLIPLIAYIQRRLVSARRLAENQPQVVAETVRRAIVNSADYADENMQAALTFEDVPSLWRYAIGLRSIPGLFLEFGVWKARSTNFFAGLTQEGIYGFDSFEGLHEDWAGYGMAKGHFDLQGNLPDVAPNVSLIKGWFDQTLPSFLAEHPEPFSFVHIDCDTYEATTTILDVAASRFVPGTVVLFDEYFGYRGWRLGEYKAWREFVIRHDIRYEYRAFGDNAVLVTIR